jgi:hypothetical protein
MPATKHPTASPLILPSRAACEICLDNREEYPIGILHDDACVQVVDARLIMHVVLDE